MTLTRESFISSPIPIEPHLRRLFPRLDAHVVFDIGSCEGEDAIRYAAFFPSATVYAFEPLPDNVELLRANLTRHRSQNIRVFQVALADQPGRAPFYVSSGQPDAIVPSDWDYGNKSSSLLPPDRHLDVHPWVRFDQRIEVETDTLERICRREGIEQIDFVHLDVQGAELKVLAGAGPYLERMGAVWMEVEAVPLYEGQPLRADVERFMAAHGFERLASTVDSVSGDQLYFNPRIVRPQPESLHSVLKPVLREWLRRIPGSRRTVRVIRQRRLGFTAGDAAPENGDDRDRRRAPVGTCNEKARADWVAASLRALPSGWRLLDAGAGEQPYRAACSHLLYVSQDFAQYDGVGDGVGLQHGAWKTTGVDIVSDIASIPEADASFDAILCTEVLEHVPNPVLAIGEFARLLRPGGTLILTAPFASLTHQAPYHFSSGLSRYWYEHHLVALGFRITEMTPNGGYFDYLAQEHRRLQGVSREYGAGRERIYERIASGLTLRMLTRFSRRDQGSWNLLTFGWHVKAMRLERG